MRAVALAAVLATAGCGVAYHSPPGLNPADSVEFRNAAGERRWCPSPNPPSAGTNALNFLAGGVGGLIGGQIGPSVNYPACAANLRDRGYAPLDETPPPTEEVADRERARRSEADARAALSRSIAPDTN